MNLKQIQMGFDTYCGARCCIAVIFLLTISSQSYAQKLSDSGKLPFEFIKEKIIIPVTIKEKKYRFLLDTGGIFEVSEELKEEFGFREVGSTTIVDINKRELEIASVEVPEVRIGNWTFENRKAIVSDLTNEYPYSCFELDGMIGRDFFDRIILHFDYSTLTFRMMEDEDLMDTDKGQRAKMKLSRRGLPQIKLSINGKSTYLEWDSGSGDFYSPKTADAELRHSSDEGMDILQFQGAFSFGITMENVEPSHRYMEKVESFELAGVQFTNFYSQFSKVSAPRIGAAILKYGSVTLDYKNGWFYYRPYHGEMVVPDFETFGFDIAIEDGGYKVKYLLVGSSAYEQGLRPGNKILRIDDLSTEGVEEDCSGYLNGYTYKDKNMIDVTFVDNESERKTIRLKKDAF